jgi:meiotically up-regulated gene 157 (Mug157) protein
VQGVGVPAKRCGLVRSGFRPSDDRVLLPFHVPGNAMFATYLEKNAPMISALDADFGRECRSLAAEIQGALKDHGQVKAKVGQEWKTVYAYEVDGFGNHYLIDDANIPGLLSMPYYDFTSYNDPIYLNTRELILSTQNPYYFTGDFGAGIGGAHVFLDHIWPMSIAVQGITALKRVETGNVTRQEETALLAEVRTCLSTLLNTTDGEFVMHESFLKTDPAVYTRSWFAWANSLFGELILSLYHSSNKDARGLLKEKYAIASRQAGKVDAVFYV